MKTRFAFIMGLLLAAAAPAAFAQQQQPLLSVRITEIQELGPTSPNIFGSNPDAGFGLAANGGNGPYTDTINIWALATGTNPEGGFAYTFYVNGQLLGQAIDSAPSPTPTPMVTPTPVQTTAYAQGVSWTPPQPGVYYFSCKAVDNNSHVATSLAVEYFATGISIVSPVTNSLVPLGSSVVVEAASAVPSGAISRVDFYVDGGPNSGGTFLGSSVNYPYSVIYTPDGPIGKVHFLTAVSYDADGVTVAYISGLAGPTSIIVVAPVTPIPVCTISTPSGTPAMPSTSCSGPVG